MKLWIPNRNNVPGTNIFVEILTKDNGELGANDRKVMMLVPGGPGGNHTVYNSIKKDLLEFADLILFDPRGCGYSDASSVEYCSLNHFIDDIEALRHVLELKNFILLGGSYGSIAALGYATKYPEFLEKLILISGGMADSQYLQTARNYLKLNGSIEQIELKKISDLKKVINLSKFIYDEWLCMKSKCRYKIKNKMVSKHLYAEHEAEEELVVGLLIMLNEKVINFVISSVEDISSVDI
jgi:pimeloyl-ACP methyl ester carboxylesterase